LNFAANIRNPHTRRAYYRAAEEFLAWCASAGVPSIAAVQTGHVATWIEMSGRELAAPSGRHRAVFAAAAEGMFAEDFAGRVLPFEARAAARYPEIVKAWPPFSRDSSARVAVFEQMFFRLIENGRTNSSTHFCC
jgi:hypothetical protein